MEDPRWARDPTDLDDRAEDNREKLRENYDAHARDLEPFPRGTPVAVLEKDALGKPLFCNTGVIVAVKPQHCYEVRQDKGGIIVRNRTHLRRRHATGFATGPATLPRAPRAPPAAPPPPPAAAPLPPEALAGRPLPATAVPRPNQARPPPRAPSTRNKKPNPWVTGTYWAAK